MISGDLVVKILENLSKADSFKLNMNELHSLGEKNEIDIILQYLSESQCIAHNTEKGLGYKLTPTGVAFLDKQKSERNQHEFNILIAFTGSIVALTEAYRFLKEDFAYHFVNALYVKLIFFGLIIICAIPLAKIIIRYFWKEVLRR